MNKAVGSYTVDIYQDRVFLEDIVNNTTGEMTPDDTYALAAELVRKADKAVAWQMRNPSA